MTKTKNNKQKYFLGAIGVIIIVLVALIFAKPSIEDYIADKNNYEEIVLDSYQLSTLEEDGKTSAELVLGFTQAIDEKSASKKIFIAQDIDGKKIGDKTNIRLDPEDRNKLIVEAAIDEDEKDELYLFIDKGLKAEEKGFRSSRETEKIELNIQSPEELERLGLGQNESKSVHNDKHYEWYMTQTDTGEFSNINCGPASVIMALKWADRDFDKTVEDARAAYRPEGGWWFTDNIVEYLNDHENTKEFVEFTEMDPLLESIDAGNIAILCLDASKISENIVNEEERVGLYYSPYSGHFIVAKGYKIVDGQIFLETYDPYLGEIKYENGVSKGRNRYYKAEEVLDAARDWYAWAIVVEEKLENDGELELESEEAGD